MTSFVPQKYKKLDTPGLNSNDSYMSINGEMLQNKEVVLNYSNDNIGRVVSDGSTLVHNTGNNHINNSEIYLHRRHNNRNLNPIRGANKASWLSE